MKVNSNALRKARLSQEQPVNFLGSHHGRVPWPRVYIEIPAQRPRAKRVFTAPKDW